MSGREPPRLSDPDDWFVDSDGAFPSSVGGAPFLEAADATREDPGAADDWLDGEPSTARDARTNKGPTVTLGTLLAVGAVVLVLILVAGLALGGVFSGGGKKGATSPPTTPTVTTTQTHPTTTPAAPTVLAAPTTTLKPGDQGAEVKKLQRALKRLGYAAGAVDGDYGVSTQAALTRFQTASKLTADGVLGPATLRALKQALRTHG
jgi:hypothetical protein